MKGQKLSRNWELLKSLFIPPRHCFHIDLTATHGDALKFSLENSLKPPIPQIVTPPFAKQKNHKNAQRPIMKLGDEFPKYTYSCHWDYVDDFFNIKNTICCDSTLYKKSAGNACCGNEIYSKRKQFCCWNPDFPKIGDKKKSGIQNFRATSMLLTDVGDKMCW